MVAGLVAGHPPPAQPPAAARALAVIGAHRFLVRADDGRHDPALPQLLQRPRRHRRRAGRACRSRSWSSGLGLPDRRPPHADRHPPDDQPALDGRAPAPRRPRRRGVPCRRSSPSRPAAGAPSRSGCPRRASRSASTPWSSSTSTTRSAAGSSRCTTCSSTSSSWRRPASARSSSPTTASPTCRCSASSRPATLATALAYAAVSRRRRRAGPDAQRSGLGRLARPPGEQLLAGLLVVIGPTSIRRSSRKR